MKVVPLPEGSPRQHQGFSHTLKHYLSPAEMWEDLADDLPQSVRPQGVVESLGELDTPAWTQQAPAIEPALAQQWRGLRDAYHVGYIGTVAQHAADVPDPSEAPQRWQRKYNRATTHLGESGIVYRVIRRKGAWEMYTAFRVSKYPHPAHWCPPRDAGSVSIRKTISAAWADQLLARGWRDGEDQ